MTYSGKWSAPVHRAVDRAQRLEHARRMEAKDNVVEDIAWRQQQDAFDDLDDMADAGDFDADGRL